jgi:hypothetical protein
MMTALLDISFTADILPWNAPFLLSKNYLKFLVEGKISAWITETELRLLKTPGLCDVPGKVSIS